MNSPKINDNILEQLFCITLTKSNLNELLEKCSKSEFKKIVENCFARIQIDGHTLIGRISGVCFPVKVQSFQFGLRFHLAMIGLIPLEQILDGQINRPNFQIKHFGLIQFSNIISQQAHPYFVNLYLITMDKLGLPLPSKEFIHQKHQQLSAARQKLMNEFNKPILNMPQKPVSLLSLRTSPPSEFSCSQNKLIPRRRRRRRKVLPPSEKNSCPQPQDKNIQQVKLLPPTNVPNNQIWQQQQLPMFNPSNLTGSGEIGKIMDNIQESSSSSSVAPDIICLDTNKNANTEPQTTINLSSTSEIMDSDKSVDGSKQLQMILQKENMQKISNILQKIQQEKTNEKNNGNGQTTTFSPKKKRRASSSSSSTSSEEPTLKRMRK